MEDQNETLNLNPNSANKCESIVLDTKAIRNTYEHITPDLSIRSMSSNVEKSDTKLMRTSSLYNMDKIHRLNTTVILKGTSNDEDYIKEFRYEIKKFPFGTILLNKELKIIYANSYITNRLFYEK